MNKDITQALNAEIKYLSNSLSSNTHRLLLEQFSEVLHDSYGVIERTTSGNIYALIYNHNGDFIEDITFDVSEFPKADTELASVGAVFYWIVGYIGVGKERIGASEFRIRRLKKNNSMGNIK